MNFSLKRRIQVAFMCSFIIVLVMGLSSFYFLDKLNDDIQNKMASLNVESSLSDALRTSTLDILKIQRNFSNKKATNSDIKRLQNTLENLSSQLKRMGSVYKKSEMKESITQKAIIVKKFTDFITKSDNLNQNTNPLVIETIRDYSDEVLNSYSDIVDKKFNIVQEKEVQIRTRVKQTKNHMLWTLLLTALGTLLISLIIPQRVSLPFRKISEAIRELQEGNFDVSIYYKQNDEIGELSKDINKMIANLKRFEELRTDRILVELRKFDILANLVKKNVIVANAEGELVYLNNSLYSLLNIKSDDVLQKNIKETILPESVKNVYEIALKRKTKIENEEVEFSTKRIVDDELKEGEFKGFANIIPIRGKESLLDYYIMIISKEMFT